jgi:hypothetical protein
MSFSQIVVEGSHLQLRDFMSAAKLLQMIEESSKIRQLCSSLDGTISLKTLISLKKKTLEPTKRESEENG